jgi:hypothetical protein
MISTWVAIVGSADPRRAEELGLRNASSAPSTVKNVGHAVAERGLGLLVFSSDPSFIESFAVAGYVGNQKAQAKGIRVVFPRDPSVARPRFAEESVRPECFDFAISPNAHWETSFFETIAGTSILILIGGGRSTFVTGVLGRILRKVVLPLDAFGGAASEVWSFIDTNKDALNDVQRALIAEDNNGSDWALSVVDVGLAALKHSEQRLYEEQTREGSQKRLVAQNAVLALLVFLFSCLLIVFTWDNAALSRGTMMTCLVGSPILAGISGAFIRKVADVFQNTTPAQSRGNWLSLGALGGIAGGFSGLLFVVAQLTATPTITGNSLPAQVSRLVPFAMITGFLAGFTADLVYSNLRESKNLEGTLVPDVLKAGIKGMSDQVGARHNAGSKP